MSAPEVAAHADAVISEDGCYRYVLTRRWGGGRVLSFVMLNPSTADASTDDATIRRCRGFARRERCDGIRVLNLYALRSPDPRLLLSHPDPAGPDNDRWLTGLADADGPVIAAWGAHAAAEFRRDEVADLLAAAGVVLWCLGTTRDGSPRHPLYARADAPLRVW